MSNTANDQFVVNAGGAAVYLAHIRDEAGVDITQAGLSTISRTITDQVTATAVTDSLTVANVVFDTLQTNANLWSVGGDAQSYNFLDAIANTKIPNRREYTLQYTFTTSGGTIFKTREITLVGD